MEVKPETISWLRKLIADKIPIGGTDDSTMFTDFELQIMLEEAASIYGAASLAWMIKAANIQQDVESYSTGDETYKMTSLKNAYEYALAMARMYEKMDPDAQASQIAMIGRLSTGEGCRRRGTVDLSRLTP